MINVVVHDPIENWQVHAVMPAVPREGDTVTLFDAFGEMQTPHVVGGVHFKPIRGCAFFEVHVRLKANATPLRDSACARLRAIIDDPATLPEVADDLRVALALINRKA